MAESVEYQVLIRHTADLQIAVKDNLTHLGAQLVSAEIITADQYEEIGNPHRSVSERGANLVRFIQNKVRQNPWHYHVFLGVLRSDLSRYSDILTKLKQTMLSVESEQQRMIPQLPPPRGGGNRLPAQDNIVQRIDRLETRFSELLQKLVSEVTIKRLSVDAFYQALITLPMAFRREYERSIQQSLPAVEESDGQRVVTSRVFLQFSPLFAFIDYNLLNHMIVKFGSAELKSEMALYIEHVKIFMRETTVGDLIDHWPGHEVPDLNYAKLKAKFRDDPMTYTLERLNKFRRRFCGQVRLSELIFCLISLELTESFFATWIIPAAIIPELSEAIQQLDKSFFEEEHIISMFVDQKQLYPSTAHDEGTDEQNQEYDEKLAENVEQIERLQQEREREHQQRLQQEHKREHQQKLQQEREHQQKLQQEREQQQRLQQEREQQQRLQQEREQQQRLQQEREQQQRLQQEREFERLQRSLRERRYHYSAYKESSCICM